MRIHVIITAYDRPEQLRALLSDLEREGQGYDVPITVYDDGSPEPLSSSVRGLSPNVRLDRLPHHGKRGYWSVVNRAFRDARAERFDFALMLPDDVRLAPGFFGRLLETWHGIRDHRKAMLNPLLDAERAGCMQWTGVRPRLRTFEGRVEVWQTGWNDCCFLCPPSTLHLLDYRVHPISPDRWDGDPQLGSGVGSQLSKRLIRRGRSLYQVAETLLYHGPHESRMNPEARRVQPLTA